MKSNIRKFNNYILTFAAILSLIFIILLTNICFDEISFWLRMQNAITVKGSITFLELEKTYGRGGLHLKVNAKYNYKIWQVTYQGSRVGVHEGSDNFSSFHKKLYHRLLPHYNCGQTATVYVNPKLPSESCLDRRLRLTLIIFQIAIWLIMLIIFLSSVHAAIAPFIKFKKHRTLTVKKT